jgi:nucleoside-diphosphate-sugar epimerase
MAARALVTGANGFIGSHLTRHLAAAGADVVRALRPLGDTWRIDDLLDDVEMSVRPRRDNRGARAARGRAGRAVRRVEARRAATV